MRLRLLKDQPFRRDLNERGTRIDVGNWRTAARLLLVFLVYRVWLKEGKPGLALVCGAHVLLCVCLSLLAQWHPELYIRNRELIVTAGQLHHTWTLIHQVLHGGTWPHELHFGQPLLLLALQLSGAPLFMFTYSVNARLAVRWNYVALPLLALLPLKAGRQICSHLLSTASVHEPAAKLYQLLDACHISPVLVMPMAAAAQQPDLLHQCMAVNAWSAAFVTVLLPLMIIFQLEWRARKRFEGQQLEQLEQLAPHLSAARPLPASTQLQPLQQPLLPLTNSHIVDAYLASCFAWFAATALVAPVSLPGPAARPAGV